MRPMRRSFAGLLSDEGGRFRPGAFGPDPLGRLHRNRRGNISILMVLLFFTFASSSALVWNTGVTISSKMHTQTAADAAAYSSTVWTSRTMNVLVGTNMMILRNHGAQIAVASASAVTIGVPILWLVELARAAGCAPPPFNIPCLIAYAARLASELPPYIQFVIDVGPELPHLFQNTFPSRISEIHDFQMELVNELPDTIEAQERNLERFYGVDIRLTVPGRGDGRVPPPAERGNFLQTAALVAFRWYAQDNNLPDEANFDRFGSMGRANTWWTVANIATIAGMSIAHREDNYVLPTQLIGLEVGPSSLDDREPFTVVATATETDASADKLVFPGIFNTTISPDDRVIAYAQAETVNGISERVALLPIPIPYPFRMWTLWGWQWQPRLTRGDQFRTAFSNDSGMRTIYGRIDITRADEGSFTDVANH